MASATIKPTPLGSDVGSTSSASRLIGQMHNENYEQGAQYQRIGQHITLIHEICARSIILEDVKR